MSHPSKRGALIVFEGPDRSGKSTQANFLRERLIQEGHRVKFMRFPDRNAPDGSGVLLSKYLAKEISLTDHEAHLLFTKQRFDLKSSMLADLRSGMTLVVDRYLHSGIAYSAAKGLDLEWCKRQEENLLDPDLVIYLRIDPELAQSRGGYGEERFETLDFQRKVCRFYDILQAETWKTIDASKSKAEAAEEIWNVVKQKLTDIPEDVSEIHFEEPPKENIVEPSKELVRQSSDSSVSSDSSNSDSESGYDSSLLRSDSEPNSETSETTCSRDAFRPHSTILPRKLISTGGS